MSIENVNELINRISEIDFFEFLNEINADSYLDERDSDPFDSTWMRNFERVKNITFSKEKIELIDSVREKCFKLVLRATSDTELASYITDDIEIIIKDMLDNNLNEWTITYLWDAYKNKRIPS